MKQFNERLSYEIFDDGYDIYNEGNAWISQREPYAHPYLSNGSYEDNAIAQCNDLSREPEPIPVETDKLKANIDFMALMLDIDLPVEEEE